MYKAVSCISSSVFEIVMDIFQMFNQTGN